MKIIKTKLDYSHSYIQFDINTISVDQIVPFDIYIKKDNDYVIIIEAGTYISETLWSKLKNHEALYISTSDEDKQILSCKSLRYYIRHNRENHQKRVALLYDVTSKLFNVFIKSQDNKIDPDCTELIIKSIIFLIKYDEYFIKNTMTYLRDEDLLEYHSLHVAIYSLALGHALKYSEIQLIKLGVAALLHDIGLKKIDTNIITKEAKLSAQESQAVQKHCNYSVEIIKQNKILDPYIIDAIMHHHERYDGTGYPNQLTKENISDFAAIIGICDVFDALTSHRPHRKSLSSFEALKLMMKDSEMINQFNQKYLLISLKMLSKGHT
ncbi:metal dependent phosphohydrolase [Sulfurimonas denitrificans DSM 1251]|uniref:Metal dependent phosphohydrolase n=1 Tax=Sulfurimonas denitrificans (strain ATCC 33889 / DSM 1251) TaxID=326298 RepID=Q30S67_SULDN|nr:HD domain-containing phosphohydrolase [Sulfurimonas denitrificans]ABB44164.1 metal dependent phosphohydrolase [Sulfurimonas denitrificans DSM 1251]